MAGGEVGGGGGVKKNLTKIKNSKKKLESQTWGLGRREAYSAARLKLNCLLDIHQHLAPNH